MRDIKFRQFVDGNFHYWGFIKEVPGGYVAPHGSGVPSERYTGLRDKNGTEIYEGDIVSFRSHPKPTEQGLVVWHEAGLRILTGDFYRTFHALNSIEVIGNEHENPELLK